MVNNKGYKQADFAKSRDMSYLSRAEIRKKEYFETHDTLKKSINIIRDYYKVDRLNVIADFCAGNTFNGYFALSRGYTKYVWFIDQRFSKSSGVLSTYYQRFVPRTMYIEENIFLKDFKMPEYSLVLSVHPCRDLAYRVAEIAIQNRKPVVIVPCCVGGPRRSWIDAFDGIDQYTRYSMKIAQFIEENNYSISIRTINKKFTPRNNIIIGIPKEDKKYEV
jgi:hypothetical protein